MTCKECNQIVETSNSPYVVRKCDACGREMKVHESGKHGRGIKIREGDSLVIPNPLFDLSIDPRKGRVRLTRFGVSWFGEKIFVDGALTGEDKFTEELRRISSSCEETLRNSERLSGIDTTNGEWENALEILKEDRNSTEWWVFLVLVFVNATKDAIKEGDILKATWAASCMERCRSMVVFKDKLEDVVWMGFSAKRVVDVLRIWKANQKNTDEAFWQQTFSKHSFVLSQLFAVPVVFIEESAYVGGMTIDRKNAKLVDYLLAEESSRGAVLIEIKTPVTKLLGGKYRQVFKPSSELSGAVIQILDYRDTWISEIKSVAKGRKFEGFTPRCVVIAGDASCELNSEERRRSFEFFRGNQAHVEIVTFDEVFRKIELLAELFNLTVAKSPSPTNDS